MKRSLRSLIALICFAGAVGAAPITAPIPTTVYTRQFLTSATPVNAINALGISQTNAYGFGTDQFSVSGSNVVLKSGAGITNPAIVGSTIQWSGTSQNLSNLASGLQPAGLQFVSQTNIIYVSPTNVYPTLSNIVWSAPDNSTVYLLPGVFDGGGTLYWANDNVGSLNIYQKKKFKLLGMPGARIYNPTGATEVLIRESQDVEVAGIIFEGVGSQVKFQDGGANSVSNRMRNFLSIGAVEVVQSGHVSIHDNSFSNKFGYAISGSFYPTLYPSSTNVAVYRNVMVECGTWTDMYIAQQIPFGGGILCSPGWDVYANTALRCGNAIRGEFKDFANQSWSPAPYRIHDNIIIDHWCQGISVMAYTNSAYIYNNRIVRKTNDVILNIPTPAEMNVATNWGIRVYDGVGLYLTDNHVEGGYFSIWSASSIASMQTNLVIRGGWVGKNRLYGIVVGNIFGWTIDGTQFVDVGAEAVLGITANPLFNGLIRNTTTYGYDTRLLNNPWLATKISGLVSNLWIYDNRIVQTISASTADGIDLAPGIGYGPCTNLVIGDNALTGVAGYSLIATNGAVPWFTAFRTIISTNVWDPASIASGANLTTLFTSRGCNLAEVGDKGDVVLPALWMPLTLGTNIVFTTIPSNQVVYVNIYNGGASALDLPSATVKILITRPPTTSSFHTQQ